MSYVRILLARYWHITLPIKINSINSIKVKNMGLTISFIFCLLSGLFAFWLFLEMCGLV